MSNRVRIIREDSGKALKERLGSTPKEWSLDERTSKMYLLYVVNGIIYCIISKTIACFRHDKEDKFQVAILSDGKEYILWDKSERPNMARKISKALAAA